MCVVGKCVMAPKKKGKGKGDKLARMTVEQRQQYLDRRAAQEAESARRKEELLAGFLKVIYFISTHFFFL